MFLKYSFKDFHEISSRQGEEIYFYRESIFREGRHRMAQAEERKSKRVCESRTEQVQIILNQHINGFHRLFGGQLMAWIDTAGAVTARRHSGYDVTTAAVDNLVFGESVEVNSTLVLTGEVTWVGNTSMEVRVDTYVETFGGQRSRVNRAYLVFVAMDEEMRPVQVPGLLLETEEEKQEFENGKFRQLLRKQRRQKGY